MMLALCTMVTFLRPVATACAKANSSKPPAALTRVDPPWPWRPHGDHRRSEYSVRGPMYRPSRFSRTTTRSMLSKRPPRNERGVPDADLHTA